MAFTTLTMENPKTGAIKESPLGFSWTMVFFFSLPALFRSDWSGFILMTILIFFTAGLSNLYFIFVYNKMYLKKLIGEGFKVKSSEIPIEELSLKAGVKLERVV